MKKITKLLTVAAGFAALFFAGCSDGGGTVSSIITDETSNLRDYTVGFVGANGESLSLSSLGITESSDRSARTIYDTGVGDLETFKFYLWGTDEVTSSSITPKEVTFTADASDASKGKVALDLGSSKYKLVLAAVKGTTTETTGDGIKGVATYIGYANVDTRSTSTIRFVISSDGLTGESTVTLKVKYDGLTTATPSGSWTADDVSAVKDGIYGAYTIKAGIYKRSDGSPVGTPTDLTINDFFDDAGTGATFSATVQAGTYNFVVSFANATSGKSYEYSDTIIVLAKNDFTANVLVPDVIETAPTAPASFKVGYIKPSSVNDGEYNAVLTWEDSSTNEKYFIIDVWDIPTTAVAATTAIASIDDKATWTTAITGMSATNQKIYGLDSEGKFDNFYGKVDEGWVSGSLLKNNKNVVLKLSLGHRYIMRIAGINDAVDKTTANYAYATYDLDDKYVSADAAYDNAVEYDPEPFFLVDEDLTDASKTGYKKNATVSTCANLYRLTYHLNGGKLDFTSTIKDLTGDVVAYLTQDAGDSSGVEIHAPFKNSAAATATYPCLVKNGNRWTSWRVKQIDGDMYPYSDTDPSPTTDATENVTYYAPNKYKSYENLDLFASYVVASADVERYDDSKYVFADGEVYFTEATGKVTKVNDHAYTISSGAGTVTLNYYFDKITDAAEKKAANVAYTSLKAIVKRQGTNEVVATGDFSSSTTNRSVSFNSTPLSEGKYTVQVVGTYNGHTYTYQIVMTVEG
ncbi:MAG: hypothetical protein K6B43_01655 [Treponema sp.]|nr:hypothetical protein [Treponema sp.]